MRNILAVGAYERDNFGDYLFFEVLKRALPDDNIIPGSVIVGDMRKEYGFVTVPYDYVLDNYSVDAVWVVGGEIGGVNISAALDMSTGDILEGPLYSSYGTEVKEKIEKLLGASDRNKRAYIPDMKLYKKNTEKPLIIQSVGLKHIFVGSVNNRDLLMRAKRLVVRETQSYSLCKESGVKVTLAPDVVHSISKFYTPNKDDVERAVMLQVNKSTLDSYKKKHIKSVLRTIYDAHNIPIILFAAGTANGHDSFKAYEDIVESLKDDIDIKILDTRNPLKIIDYIAAAKIVIGTSLHVRIIASTYNVPRISLRNDKTSSYAKEWDDTWPTDVDFNELPSILDGFNTSGRDIIAGERLTARAYEELMKSINVLPESTHATNVLDTNTLLMDWFVYQRRVITEMIISDLARYSKQISNLETEMESEFAKKDATIEKERWINQTIMTSKSYRIGRTLTYPYRFFRNKITSLFSYFDR